MGDANCTPIQWKCWVYREYLIIFNPSCCVSALSGSDLPKQEEQLGEGIVNVFPWNFSQNGLVAYKNGEILEVQTIGTSIWLRLSHCYLISWNCYVRPTPNSEAPWRGKCEAFRQLGDEIHE